LAIGLGLYWVAMAFSIVIDVQSRVVDSTYILRVEFDSAHQHRLGEGSSLSCIVYVKLQHCFDVCSQRDNSRDGSRIEADDESKAILGCHWAKR